MRVSGWEARFPETIGRQRFKERNGLRLNVRRGADIFRFLAKRA